MMPAPANSPALFKIIGQLSGVKKSGTGYKALCPAHDDHEPSLGIAEGGDGRVLLTCYSNGCSAASIVAALGLTLRDLFPESNGSYRWPIRTPDGAIIAFHNRRTGEGGTKPRWWEDASGRKKAPLPINDMPLYGVAFLRDVPPGSTVYVVEGEKAADALLSRGLHAVSTYGTSHKPNLAHLEPLAGHHVRLWPDNDAPGTPHMRDIADRLAGVQVASVRWVTWPDAPEKGDAADFVGSVAEIEAMVGEAPPIDIETAAPSLDRQSGIRLDVVRMSDVRPEPIEWSWRGRFARGKPTLLMGDPGLGKSLITHYSAAIVSTGGLWPDGGRCTRGTAILFTTEDGLADTVAPRLIAAGADTTRVLAVRGVVNPESSLDARMFTLTEHLALLEQLIEEHDGQFVAIDPITAYLGPDVNSHKEADVRRVLAPLSLLAERTRIVLVMLMHLNKGTGVSALYRATGSIAFPAVARVVLGVAPDPNDPKRRLLLPVKMNIAKDAPGIGYRIETDTSATPILVAATAEGQPPVLLWDDEPVTVDATSALDSAGTASDRGMKLDVKNVLLGLLPPGTRRPSRECWEQIKKETNCVSGSLVGAAKSDLGIISIKDSFTGGWYWEMPEQSARAHVIPPQDSSDSSGLLGENSDENADHADATTAAEQSQPPQQSPTIPKNPGVARACEDCGEATSPHERWCHECWGKRQVF